MFRTLVGLFLTTAAVIGFASRASAAGAPYQAIELYPLSAPPGALGANDSRSPQVVSGGQAVGSVRISGSSTGPPDQIIDHAAVWTSAEVPVDLNPAGFATSLAEATNGMRQVGSAAVNPSGPSHAFLWAGTSASGIDLHPTNIASVVSSQGSGISVNGAQQVGELQYTDRANHAALWNGTPLSVVDLNPQGFDDSGAFGSDGTHQTGQAFNFRNGQFSNFHAILWSGSAALAVDLHPAGYLSSSATGVSGDQQVGSGTTPPANGDSPPIHALLWRGTADSVVDLNPSQFGSDAQSAAAFTNGTQQAGYYILSSGGQRAMIWSGTPGSAVDLGSLLGARFSDSTAVSIDAIGDVFGIAHGPIGNATAIEWIPVPEPSCLCFLVIAVAMALARRRCGN